MGENNKVSTKIDLNYSEERVVFSICNCSLDKDFSFYKLSKREAKRFLKTLKKYERMEWRQLSSLPRKNGITKEKPGTKSYEMIKEKDKSGSQVTGEPYYFHFRVDGTDNPFRVFGYQEERFFHITHIDREGNIHHS